MSVDEPHTQLLGSALRHRVASAGLRCPGATKAHARNSGESTETISGVVWSRTVTRLEKHLYSKHSPDIVEITLTAIQNDPFNCKRSQRSQWNKRSCQWERPQRWCLQSHCAGDELWYFDGRN